MSDVVNTSANVEPVVTESVKTRSDERMKRLLRIYGHSSTQQQSQQQTQQENNGNGYLESNVGDVSDVVSESSGGAGSASMGGVPLKEDSRLLQDQPKDQTQGQSQKEQVGATDDSVQEGDKKSVQYWKRLATSFQSKYDELQSRHKSLEEKLSQHELVPVEEAKELRTAKQRVDEFTKDPISFVLNYMPDLAQRLAKVGDPLKMVEDEVAEYRSQLLSKFKQEYGGDWEYNPIDAETPGSPSFRFRIAIADKIDEVRARYRQYVNEQQERIRLAEASKHADIERIKSEYGFTDEDIKRAEEKLNTEPVNYYNLLRLALLEDILNRKIATIKSIPPKHIPADVTKSPGARSIRKESVELSEQGKQTLARFGKRIFR